MNVKRLETAFEVLHLKNTKRSFREIAKQFSKSIGWVQYQLALANKYNKDDLEYLRIREQQGVIRSMNIIVQQFKKEVGFWSPGNSPIQTELIKRLRDEGFSITNIADYIGRSTGYISRALNKNNPRQTN